METSNTIRTTNDLSKKTTYPGESLGPLLKFLAWFIFIVCLITGIAVGDRSSSNLAETYAIVIIVSSIPTSLIFGALGCILENVVQIRKANEGI
jgi:magnesium-transporting ATPase (P-type)